MCMCKCKDKDKGQCQSLLTKSIYVLGGIMVVLAAAKMLCYAYQWIKDFCSKDAEG